jgi:glucose-1-phosphate adenylyltransferase
MSMHSMRARAGVGEGARGRARTRTRASARRGCPSPSHGTTRERQQGRGDGVKAQNARFDAWASAASAVDASAVRGRAETTSSTTTTSASALASASRASEARQTTSERARRRIKMRDVRCVVLAGGADETNPLTKNRARSAMRLGGPYRVIDFPMTNLINSGARQMYVLTQYNSHSLVSHVSRAFPAEMFGNNYEGFVEVLPTSQSREHGDTWSVGSADCVLRHLTAGSLTKQRFDVEWEDECLAELGSLQECSVYAADGVTIVLAAEQLYKMDFNQFLEQHLASGADVTIGVHTDADAASATRLGVMDVDENTGEVFSFVEKPDTEKLAEFMECSTEAELNACSFKVNMGVYAFNNSVLEELLVNSKVDSTRHEFGSHVIPYALDRGYKVSSFRHEAYWQPIRSLRDCYEANISVATDGAAASLLSFDRVMFTKPNFLPPTTFYGSSLVQGSIVSDGCVIHDESKVIDSVVGPCTILGKNVSLERVVLVGRDEMLKRAGTKVPDVGENTTLRNCVVDSDAIIGANVSITNARGIQNMDCSDYGYVITEGIVTILGGVVIPDGFKI